GCRYRALDLDSGQIWWEADVPGDTLMFQAASGGRIGALTLGSERAEFRWLEQARSTLPPRGPVPLGVDIEVALEHTCDLVQAEDEVEQQLVRAQVAYRARDWRTALECLASVPPDGRHHAHVLHLRGLAALMAGDFATMDAAFN